MILAGCYCRFLPSTHVFTFTKHTTIFLQLSPGYLQSKDHLILTHFWKPNLLKMFQLVNISIIIWELICIITMYHVYTRSFLCWSVVIASSSQVLNMGHMRRGFFYTGNFIPTPYTSTVTGFIQMRNWEGQVGKVATVNERSQIWTWVCFDETPTMLCCLAKAKTHFLRMITSQSHFRFAGEP